LNELCIELSEALFKHVALNLTERQPLLHAADFSLGVGFCKGSLL
jgi:hypothetical protein